MMDGNTKTKRWQTKTAPTPKIKWWKLKDRDLQEELKESLTQKICPTVENAETWWKETVKVIHVEGEQIMGLNLGKPPLQIKTPGGAIHQSKRLLDRRSQRKRNWMSSAPMKTKRSTRR